MIAEIKEKIRALITDLATCQSEFFEYENSPIFTLCGTNINSIQKVLINGNELASGETYDFDSATNKITITATLNSGDQIEIAYCYQKYSDTEILEYIRASLVWLSIFSFCSDEDFELEEDNEIYPTPSNKEQDLIALISSILIKPDYESYKLPNLTVSYPRSMTKEERIEKLIIKFKRGLGIVDTIEFE
jgi:hypothetical protein